MRRFWLIFAQAVTICVAFLFVINTLKPDWFGTQKPAADSTGSNPVTFIEATGTSAALKPSAAGSFAVAAQRAMPSVVYIFTRQEARQERIAPFLTYRVPGRSGLGSGVIVEASGYILTNNHVINGADKIEVVLHDGRRFAAHIAGVDRETDLAVVKIDADSKLPAITFATNDSLAIGDIVLAIGNPFGIGQTVTLGIASALGRYNLGFNDSEANANFQNFIQTDAAINSGNSGGALVNVDGHLVGINTAIFTQSGDDGRAGGSLGIGFAIPVSVAKNVLRQIIERGEVIRGWAGVELGLNSPEFAGAHGVATDKGVLIEGMIQNGPAHAAGVLPGDVLVVLDGKPVQSPHDVLEKIASMSPGQVASLRLWRGKKQVDVKMKVGRRPR